jgi:phage terminase large subunit
VTEAAQFYGALTRSLEGELARSRGNLVPEAFAFLWQQVRFLVAYGGRNSGKSWSIARVLLVLAYESPLRILCCREIQSSINASAYQLLCDQIALLHLEHFFTIQATTIIGRNGSAFLFEGLKANASRIRSLEGVDVCWVEEAQSVSELSFETLLPTVRRPGSRFYISFNPMSKDDPVYKRFITSAPPNTIARKSTFEDNPHRSAESESERQWLERSDPDAYAHVWLGEPRSVSDALILKGKFVVESIDEVRSDWGGPYHGADYGFANDPSAAVRAYVDDSTGTLYVTHEFWALRADIDQLPAMLEGAIPGIGRHRLYCDSARPESTSYLARNGIPDARSVEKWAGSVADGIAFLRSFARIVIDPSCKHLIDEARNYCFKQDRLSGAPLPVPEDKNNHCIDALRYALSDLIRAGLGGGFFSQAAFMVAPKPLQVSAAVLAVVSPVETEEPPREEVKRWIEMPEKIDTVFAIASSPLKVGKQYGGALGVVYFGYSMLGHREGFRLGVLDWELADLQRLDGALEAFLAGTLERLEALAVECKILDRERLAVALWVEQSGIGAALFQQGLENRLPVKLIDAKLSALSVAERAAAAKTYVARGQVKIARYAGEKVATHKGITRNHLTSELFAFNVEQDQEANALLSAWAYGVILALENPRRT